MTDLFFVSLTDLNPEDATYAIPANDESLETVTAFLSLIEETCTSKEISEKKIKVKIFRELQSRKEFKKNRRRKVSRKNKK